MPIYEYQCAACGEQCELLQKFSDAAATDCPNCHQAQLQRLVSAPSFQLKGTGWYVTDFRDKGQKTKTNENTDTSKEQKEQPTPSQQDSTSNAKPPQGATSSSSVEGST